MDTNAGFFCAMRMFEDLQLTVYKCCSEACHHSMTTVAETAPSTTMPIPTDHASELAANVGDAKVHVPDTLDATAVPAAAVNDDATSLSTLLEHIESLNNSNKQMSETLKIIETRNMERFHQVVGTKIEPWVKSLNIPVEQQQSFIKGIEVACEQGHKRGIVDFEMNPAYSIACAAATAYGKQVEEVENARQEINKMNKNLIEAQVDVSKQQNNQRNMVQANVASMCSDIKLGKRPHDDMYTNNLKEDVNEVSTCWSTVYDNMRAS
jgi:hypothetical protein